jgi:hypothetical protein
MRNYAAWADFLASRLRVPFAWGSDANDCGSFAGAAVAALTGRNPFADLRWSTETELFQLLDRLGGLEVAVSARLQRIIPAKAARGDLAAVMDGNMMGLMVVEGHTLVGPGVRRQLRRQRSSMVLAWSAD